MHGKKQNGTNDTFTRVVLYFYDPMYHDDDMLADGMTDDVLADDTLGDDLDETLDDDAEGAYGDEGGEPEFE